MQQNSSLAESIAALTPMQREQVEEFLKTLKPSRPQESVSFPKATLSEAAFSAVWSNPEDDVYDAL